MLDDLEEYSWPVFQWFGEDLQQVTFIIAVNQDAQSFQGLQVLVYMAHAVQQFIIISCRNR